jgi:hypothetical protein
MSDRQPRRRVRNVAGRAGAGPCSETGRPRPLQHQQRKFVAKPLGWLAAVIGTAITTVLVTTLTSIPAQLVDPKGLGDAVRGGPDISVVVQPINDTGSYSMAVPGRWDPPFNDIARRHVDANTAQLLVDEGRKAGGSAVSYLRVRLLLEGHRNQQIQIVDLVITDLQTAPPVRGTLVDLSEEGGSENQQLVFNLDEKIPHALDATAKDAEKSSYFTNKSISLGDNEQVVLLTQFNARRGTSMLFNLSLKYVVGGENRSLSIDNGHQPFRVTATSCSTEKKGQTDYDRIYTVADSTLTKIDPGVIETTRVDCA